jgi:hypothetical protein
MFLGFQGVPLENSFQCERSELRCRRPPSPDLGTVLSMTPSSSSPSPSRFRLALALLDRLLARSGSVASLISLGWQVLEYWPGLG